MKEIEGIVLYDLSTLIKHYWLNGEECYETLTEIIKEKYNTEKTSNKVT